MALAETHLLALEEVASLSVNARRDRDGGPQLDGPTPRNAGHKASRL
jgi:hypothetical protein